AKVPPPLVEKLRSTRGDQETLNKLTELLTDGDEVEELPPRSLTLAPEYPDGEGSVVRFFGGIAPFSPNPMQQEMLSRLGATSPGQPRRAADGLLILKARTGSGKMEAVLAPALEARRRLFLIVPNRSLADDQERRISSYLSRMS